MGLWADGLVQQYWNLGVSTSAGPVVISCNRYLMNVPGYKPMQDNIKDVQTQAPVKKKGIFIDGGAFVRAVNGKGLPADLEHILQTGVDSGVLPSNQAALQQWADSSIGVDCTGFASAYHFQCAMMPVGDSINAGCGYFYRMAKRRNPLHPFAWTMDEVQPDDVLLWMNENGVETKSPGHIAIVVGKLGNRLQVAESSGGDDGRGHKGPHLVEKNWGGVTQQKNGKCLNIGEGVIIVRTINVWLQPMSLTTTP